MDAASCSYENDSIELVATFDWPFPDPYESVNLQGAFTFSGNCNGSGKVAVVYAVNYASKSLANQVYGCKMIPPVIYEPGGWFLLFFVKKFALFFYFLLSGMLRWGLVAYVSLTVEIETIQLFPLFRKLKSRYLSFPFVHIFITTTLIHRNIKFVGSLSCSLVVQFQLAALLTSVFDLPLHFCSNFLLLPTRCQCIHVKNFVIL